MNESLWVLSGFDVIVHKCDKAKHVTETPFAKGSLIYLQRRILSTGSTYCFVVENVNMWQGSAAFGDSYTLAEGSKL